MTMYHWFNSYLAEIIYLLTSPFQLKYISLVMSAKKYQLITFEGAAFATTQAM